MEVRSITLRTEMIFYRAFGEIHDRGGHLVIRYPRNPGYHWGNCLIFSAPPVPGDEDRWPALFRREFSANPAIRHMVLAWDTGKAEPEILERFARRRLTPQHHHTLAATQVRPPARPTAGLQVRKISAAEEWDEAVRLHALESGPYEAAAYLEFSRKRFAEFRSLAEAGRGAWFGGYLDGRLVGSLGLFHEAGLARYRNVTTHPDFRRRGICGTLVHAAAEAAQRDWRVSTLVMEADPDEAAIRIYRALGFSVIEESEALYWWERPGGPPPPD